jgi:hypothetical protein
LKESVPSEKTTATLAIFAASAAKKSCHTEFYWLVIGNWQLRVDETGFNNKLEL